MILRNQHTIITMNASCERICVEYDRINPNKTLFFLQIGRKFEISVMTHPLNIFFDNFGIYDN